MNRPLPLIAGLLGVLFLAIAATYWLVPVGSLPVYRAGSTSLGRYFLVKKGSSGL